MILSIKPNYPAFLGAILLALCLFFFRIPVSIFLDFIIVKPIFSKFEGGATTDIVLVLAMFVFIIWSAREIYFGLLARVILFGLVFYIFQRLNDYWTFKYLYSFTFLAYWDIIAMASVCCLVLGISLKPKKKAVEEVVENEGFVEDSVVTKVEDDHFRRKEVASEIARRIQLTPNHKSFAIGVLGEYGSGKTSFLNLINLSLDDSKVVKISFNPWSASTPEMLRREFFDLLAKKISSIDGRISSLIYSYARRLASFDDRSLSWLNWFAFFRNGDSAQSSGDYEQIDRMLCSIDRKVVILIDDLDRLDCSEIMEVLKLIRNTANFSNVVYLVGYDKIYVQDAIKSFNKVSGTDYLDKIFQFEIPLPKREEDDLMESLSKHLKNMLTDDHYHIFENVMIPNGFRSRYQKSYEGILRHGRDVVRFVNGFKIVYQLIGKEVDFESLMLLELIKFRFPSIYDLIYTQRDRFLSESLVRSAHEQYFAPKMSKSGNKRDPENKSMFGLYLDGLDWLNLEEASLLEGMFLTLFKGSDYHRPEAKNSISYPLYFEVFFRYRLSQKDLSDKDYQGAISSGKMKEYINYCSKNNLYKELMVRLMQENFTKDQNHFENVVNWIFILGRIIVKKEGMFRFDYESLIHKISNYHNVITDKVYRKNVGEYSTFMKLLFSPGQAPFLFENELIFHLKRKGNDFIVPSDELSKYQLSYFNRMAQSNHGLSEDVLWLFWGAREYYKIPIDDSGAYQEDWRFEPNLVERMKVYLPIKDPKEFLKFSIETDIRERSLVGISPYILEMFDNPQLYRNIVAENQFLEEEIKAEYLTLFDKLAEKEFKQKVEMELKTELKKPERN